MDGPSGRELGAYLEPRRCCREVGQRQRVFCQVRVSCTRGRNSIGLMYAARFRMDLRCDSGMTNYFPIRPHTNVDHEVWGTSSS